jgi:hypothetical protein
MRIIFLNMLLFVHSTFVLRMAGAVGMEAAVGGLPISDVFRP